MKSLYITILIIIIINLILVLISYIKDRLKKPQLNKHKTSNYAILIPARDESKVIEKLLKSIQIQNKNMDNVYVIVEDENDLTCKIVENYKANIFIRPKPIRKRKGYALDECLKEILKTKHYDLYFIFDADNVLDKHFIKNMIKSYKEGYEAGLGNRNILNPVNLISCCSGLLFYILNSIINKLSIANNRTAILSGTGFYISGRIIEELGGFPFNSLTEDYELSLYLSSKNILCAYNEDAIYYDEQPTTMKVSITQRIRWMKGFFESRKKRLGNIKDNLSSKLGIVPYVIIVLCLIFLVVLSVVDVIIFNNIVSLILLVSVPILIYLVLFFMTLFLILKEKNINMSNKLKIKCLFFNPLFLFTYIYCLFASIFKKEVEWKKIEHVGL